ncbi:thioesterase-like superfamily-domain-containing protein [Mucor mucedo]|uniref:thioesterase-like superfamily-domain-containing protein n=1 Tax=Mucor mucedo TaxID=29922 RepID=UPI00221FAF6D|nr:thioesterase-like superfamily-domain-containing protein [Mucor mucedo]KAI7895297.1 thioesterase-like superfamily-domain-containing protein [Mucor mucedo]
MTDITGIPAYQFDRVTNTSYLGKTSRNSFIFTAVADSEWTVGETAHVSYVMSLITDTVLQHFSDRYQSDPIALNCFFLAKTITSNLIIEIEELKISKKGICYARAILKQTKDLKRLESTESYNPFEWIDKVHSIFTMKNMDSEKGVTYIYKNPLQHPLDTLEPYTYPYMADFVDCLFDTSSFAKDEKDVGKPEQTQVMTFKDGRPTDFKSIPYWCDMIISSAALIGPAMTGGPVWCATIQMEVQFKRKPTGQKITAHLITKHIINGRFEIDGEIWNEQGEILAITRHQSMIVPWSRNIEAKI